MAGLTEEQRRKLTAAARRGRRALAAIEAETGEPAIVGVAEAAEFLEVGKPKIWRLIEQERMPKPIAELSSGRVWIREELRALRDELQVQRERRAAA